MLFFLSSLVTLLACLAALAILGPGGGLLLFIVLALVAAFRPAD